MTIQKLNLALDPSKEKERKKIVEEAIFRYETNFGNLDLERSYMPMFELLWYGQLPCVDVKGFTSEVKDELSFIKRCFWKTKPINCNAIFQKRPTDRGMCCSFNMERADKALKDSVYKDAISMRQSKDSKHSFEEDKKPQWFIENNEPIPEVGIKKGLTLIVDGHTDRLSSATIFDNFRGFPIAVHDKNKFPLMGNSGLKARPGFESNIQVSAVDLHALDDIRHNSPEKRNCYFPDEYGLQVHQKYSQANCIFECSVNFASKCLASCKEIGNECNCENEMGVTIQNVDANDTCVPWFYPSNNEKANKICNPWQTMKFKKILEEKLPEDLCEHCLSDCIQTKYGASVSYADFQKCDSTTIGNTNILCSLVHTPLNPAPWTYTAQNEYRNANISVPWFLNTNSGNNISSHTKFSDKRSKLERNHGWTEVFGTMLRKNPTYNAFDKDIGIVNVFFNDGEILRYVKANQMSFFDFMSQIGGSLGLVMGISITSLVEIFYWITFRLYTNLTN